MERRPFVVCDLYERSTVPNTKYIYIIGLPVSDTHNCALVKSYIRGEKLVGEKLTEYWGRLNDFSDYRYKVSTDTYPTRDAALEAGILAYNSIFGKVVKSTEDIIYL